MYSICWKATETGICILGVWMQLYFSYSGIELLTYIDENNVTHLVPLIVPDAM